MADGSSSLDFSTVGDEDLFDDFDFNRFLNTSFEDSGHFGTTGQLENSDLGDSVNADDADDFELGICERCAKLEKTFFQPYPPGNELFPHHLSFSDIDSSATSGCKLCQVLRDGILDDCLRKYPRRLKSIKDARHELQREDLFIRDKEGEKSRTWNPYHMLVVGQCGLQIQGAISSAHHPSTAPMNSGDYEWNSRRTVRKRPNMRKDCDILFMIGAIPGSGDFWTKSNQFSGARPMESSMIGDPALLEGRFCGRRITPEPDLRIAKAWIKECRERHGCEQLEGSRIGPTRLICVGEQGKLHVMSKLVETGGESHAYVCLSHRWPTSLRCKTSKNKYKDHLGGLDWDFLPATFQDAIRTTSALGFNFLWIDSLCIIQDDSGDWERECPKMAAIYAGAQVTIAAPAAVDSESGFLKPRFKTRRVPSCTLRYRGHNGNVTSEIEFWYPAFRGKSNDIRSPEKTSVLDTRGWILQERILSSRVLYFGSQQLYLECNSCAYFEMLQNPVSAFKGWDGFPKQKFSSLNIEGLFGWWLKLVDNFTSRELTFPHDKLPALSGVASLIHQATKSEYLAGLWREDLARGLIWSYYTGHREAEYGKVGVVAPYLAPTWSWARSDCGTAAFEYYETLPKLQLCPEVLLANVELAGNDPFGLVKSGSLDIRGKTRRGVIRRIGDDYQDYPLGLFDPEAAEDEEPRYFKADSARFGENLQLPPDSEDDEDYLEATLNIRRESTLTARPGQDVPAVYEKEVLTLLVSQFTNTDEDYTCTFGLALVPVHGQSAYMRVGRVSDAPTEKIDEAFSLARWFWDAEETTLKII